VKHRPRAVVLIVALSLLGCSQNKDKDLPSFRVAVSDYVNHKTLFEKWIEEGRNDLRYDPGSIILTFNEQILFDGDFSSAWITGREVNRRVLTFRLRNKKTEAEMLALYDKLFKAGNSKIFSSNRALPLDVAHAKSALIATFRKFGARNTVGIFVPLSTKAGAVCVSIDFIGGGKSVDIHYRLSDCGEPRKRL
jgi:hypothetical protein